MVQSLRAQRSNWWWKWSLNRNRSRHSTTVEHVSLSLLFYSSQGNMGTLLTMQPLLLLLLLLQPFPFQSLKLQKYLRFEPSDNEEFEDYAAELYSTGPTKPPTKELFLKDVIVDYERPLSESTYCYEVFNLRNIRNRSHCKKEHFFLAVEYDKLQEMCRQRFVACRNGVKRCHRSHKIIEGVYCSLTYGVKVPNCYYKSVYKKGYVLITCRWQDDIRQIIPSHVNDILEIHDQH